MKRLFTLWILCILITGMSQAQVTNGTTINSEIISQNLTSFTHDQVEDFIIENYSYNHALEDLNVVNDYRINKSLTKFVFEHITGFYTLVYDGIEQQNITSSNEVHTMYLNFIDSTKSIIENKEFIDKPVINNPPEKQLNGPCVNMDFEDGDLNGWDLYDGKVDGTTAYSFINAVPVGSGASHLIVTAGNDPVVGIPMVNPDGGTFSCRLGDGTGTGYNAAKMTQSFMVTATNSIFSYSYAVVFQDPGHSIEQQPYFSVRVYDQFGNDINCGTYNVIAGGGIPGFQNGPGGVLYKDWTTVFSQLNGYIGQNITIEFTTGDCGQGGHYGYAYVDANCQPFDITTSTGDTVLCAGDTMTLFAPQGGASYLWNTGETTSSIDITAGGHYTVDIIPVQGNQCAIVLDINIVELPVPVPIFTANPTQVCIGDAIIFNDASTIANPSVINTWKWNFGDGISTPASNGNVLGVPQTSGTYTAANHLYNTIGTFDVTLTVESSNYHCADSVTHQIQVNPMPIVTIVGDTIVCYGEQTTLTASGADTYSWNNGITNGTAFTPPVGTTVYTVTGTTVGGCEKTAQITVIANPLPVVGYTASDEDVCDGVSVTLTGTGATTYTWDNGILNGVAFVQAVGTTVYTVTGTNINGCTNTAQVAITTHALPIVGFTVTDDEVCDGTSVTLTGTGASTYTWDNSITNGVAFVQAVGTTIYTVTGTDVNGCIDTAQASVIVNPLPNVFALGDTVCNGEMVTLNGQNAVTYTWDNGVINGQAFTPSLGSTNYIVTGTDANGCENNYTTNVMVNPLPHVGYTASDDEVCDGASVTLTGTGATTYTWDNGISNGVAFVQAVGTTVYTVTGTNINGCTDTAQVAITTHALPIVGFTVTDDEVCDGTSVTLTGTGASTYTWDNGITNGVAFVQAVGTTIYTVTGTDVNGCIDTAQASVIVNPLPNVFALGDTVCNGEMVTLNGQNAATYTWDNGVINGQAFTPSLGSTNYIVTGTDANGCKNSYTANVMVNPLPHVSAGQDFSICAGATAILTGSGAGVGGIYTWNNGVNDGASFSPSDTAIYTVIGTDINGCTGTDQATILVVPIPVVDFTADKFKGCAPLEPVFTNNSTGILTDCQWSFSNGENLVGCGAVSTSFEVEGCYDVTLTVSTPEGCTNTMTKTNYVCVLANPVADFYTDPKELSTVNWEAGMMNESVGGNTYHWDFGDNSSASTAFEPRHAFPNSGAGTYLITLTVTNVDGCVDEISRPITVTDELIYYVPNAFTPDNDNYNEAFKPVFGTGYDPQGYTLYIFNRWGDLLFESHNTDVGWDGKFNNNIVEDGVYIWKIIIKHKDSDDKDTRIGNVSLLR